MAKEKLLKEFHGFPSVLTVYMTAQMYDALGDLVAIGHLAPADLFERFLAWARRAAICPDDPDPGTRTEQSTPNQPKAVAA